MRSYVDVSGVFVIKKIYTAFEDKFDKDFYFGGEQHNFWEFVTVLEGEIGVTAGSDVFQLKKGQAVIHEPMEFHRIWSEGNTCPTVIIFSFAAENMPPFTSKIFEIADLMEPKIILDDILHAFLVEGFKPIDINLEFGVDYQLAVKKLEMYIIRAVSQKVGSVSVVKSKGAENYAAIINAMENNIDKNLSVADIAKICSMSEINLKKTFSKYSGMGVMKYFNTLKVTAAKEMIKRGVQVSEAASKLGFENQNYFSTVFRRISGKPPSYYKQWGD